MMKKTASESCLWAALAPNLDEELRETVVHVEVSSDHPSVLKRNGGDMARFSDEKAAIFFCPLRDLLSFGYGDSPGNSQTVECILVTGSYR